MERVESQFFRLAVEPGLLHQFFKRSINDVAEEAVAASKAAAFENNIKSFHGSSNSKSANIL